MKTLKKLILVEVAKEPKQIVDKKDGHTLLKYRHVFMTPEGTELIGWSDDDGYRADCTPALKWDDKLAKEWLFEDTTFLNEPRSKLIRKAEAELFLKGIPKK